MSLYCYIVPTDVLRVQLKYCIFNKDQATVTSDKRFKLPVSTHLPTMKIMANVSFVEEAYSRVLAQQLVAHQWSTGFGKETKQYVILII